MAEKNIQKVENNVPQEFLIPPALIYETSDSYIVELDLAGADRDSTDISIEEDVLKIRADVKFDLPKDVKITLEELEPLTYYREFKIGKGIDVSKVEGHFEDGVLKIVLSKKEELKPKKIEISTE